MYNSCAAQYLHVALTLYTLRGQPREDLHRIVPENFIVMPCIPMRVHEDVYVGKIVVVIDDVGEVGHNLCKIVSPSTISNLMEETYHGPYSWVRVR